MYSWQIMTWLKYTNIRDSTFRNSYSLIWWDELYRVFDTTYYSRLWIDWWETYYPSPELTGQLLVSDLAPYLTANEFCESQGHTSAIDHNTWIEVDSWTNTVYYWYATDSWNSTWWGTTYEYINCYTQPTYSFEEAQINLMYTNNVYIFHLLFIVGTWFFIYVINLYYSKKF